VKKVFPVFQTNLVIISDTNSTIFLARYKSNLKMYDLNGDNFYWQRRKTLYPKFLFVRIPLSKECVLLFLCKCLNKWHAIAGVREGNGFGYGKYESWTFVSTDIRSHAIFDRAGHLCSHQMTTPDIRAHIKLPPRTYYIPKSSVSLTM